MGFAGILFGLPLAALPVIVHLLARRRKKIVPWGAMQFLVAAKQPARRSWRLRDILLLLLRILALLALIFAIAQPEIPIKWLGGHEPRDIIIVFDESMSTAALDGTKTVYERQQETLKQLLADKDVDGTDYLRVLIAAAQNEWLSETALSAQPSNQNTLIESLSKRKPSLAAADLPTAIEIALAAPATKSDLSRHVFVITDAQAYGWNPDMTGRWSAAKDKLNAFPAGSEIRVIPTSLEGSETSNLVVQKVEVAREVVAAMEPVAFRATITNFSDSESDTAIVHWLVDDEEIGIVTVPTIEPGSDSTVGIEHSFLTPGRFSISCRMDGSDALAVDDEAVAMIEVATGIPVLLVEGVPSDDPLKTDSAFLLAALGGFNDDIGGLQVPSPFRPTLVESSSMDTIDLSDYKVVVWANAPPTSTTTVERLQAFVREGGGLWISLGNQMQPEWFNRHLVAKGAGLSPLEIGDATGDADERERFDQILPPTQPHPATQILADTDKLDIDQAKIYRRFPFSEPVPRGLSVLLRVNDGSPLAIEHAFGAGRVIVQSVPLGATWSNMPLLLSYVAMAHEWLWYLVEPTLVKCNLSPGDPIAFDIENAPGAGNVTIRPPDNKPVDVGSISVSESMPIRFHATLNPGVYHVGISSDESWRKLDSFSVDRDPEESSLSRLTEADRTKLRDAGLVFGSEELPVAAKVAGNDRTSRKPIWEWLLIAVIAFLIGESALALWSSKSRQLKSAGASM